MRGYRIYKGLEGSSEGTEFISVWEKAGGHGGNNEDTTFIEVLKLTARV